MHIKLLDYPPKYKAVPAAPAPLISPTDFLPEETIPYAPASAPAPAIADPEADTIPYGRAYGDSYETAQEIDREAAHATRTMTLLKLQAIHGVLRAGHIPDISLSV